MIGNSWRMTSPLPPLGAHRLQLWWGHVGSIPDAWKLFLAREERSRAQNFLRAVDRTRFLAARMMLRRLLAAALSVEPAALEFDYGENGKPALRGDPTLSFSVSHSGEVVLIGLSRAGQIGVDVEAIRSGVDWGAIASACFSPSERQAIASTPATLRTAAFYTSWVRKEAYLKMRGTGLIDRLCDIDLKPIAGSKAMTVMIAGRLLEQPLFLFESWLDGAHVSAAVAERADLKIDVWKLDRA